MMKFTAVALAIVGALGASAQDSLAHFRLGESQFRRHEFQSAANEFLKALNGEPHLKWIDVWAHFDVGEIFDITGQRERAVREYHTAARIGDDTEHVQALIAARLDRAATVGDIERQGVLVEYLSVPKAVTRAEAMYSGEARIAELEGTVTLAAMIAANGSATDLRVVNPLGLGLDEAAKTAAARWVFEPGKTKDGPAPMLATMQLSFLLPWKRSHWHLLGVAFATPDGALRPRFLSAKYPGGSGIRKESLIPESDDRIDTSGTPRWHCTSG